jgi:hypothetical protein
MQILSVTQILADMTNDELNQLSLSFGAIDRLLAEFKLLLPTVQLHSTRQMLVIHSLVNVATIQLHHPFAVDVEASRLRELGAAQAVVANLRQVPVNDFIYIDPIMGVRRASHLCTLRLMEPFIDLAYGYLSSICSRAGALQETSTAEQPCAAGGKAAHG